MKFMETVLVVVLIIVAISVVYTVADPSSHNSYNGGNQPGFKPKSKTGMSVDSVLKAIGGSVVVIVVLGSIIVGLISFVISLFK